MDDFYIPSAYKRYQGFEDFKTKKYVGQSLLIHERLAISDLLLYNKLFLIGEPGYGKTRTMDRIACLLNETGESFLLLKGKNFKSGEVKKGISFILFDALDESEDVLATFIEVINFCNQNNIKLIISNRLHYMPRIEALLINTEFVFVELLPFFPDQIKTYLSFHLESLGFSTSDFERIQTNSIGSQRESVLRVPRYLNEFVKFIISSNLTPSEVSEFTRTDLFEKVIYFKLDAASKGNRNVNKKYLTKRILERLSLVMEIYGVNQISKEDFITFLDQTNSNISTMLLSAVDLDSLLERVMNSVGDYLYFEHTEFQEYLAAKELVRFGHRHQTVFDLMVQPELGLIKENWLDVLSYAIQLEPKFVLPILAFIKQQEYLVDEKLIRLVISVNTKVVNSGTISNGLSDFIFETCFKYYKTQGQMMHDVSEQLAELLDKDLPNFLEPLYELNKIIPPVFPIVYNQIAIVKALATKQRLNITQKIKWEKYLLSIVKQDNLKAIADVSYYAMIALNEATGLLRNLTFFEHKPNELFDKYLRTISKIRPNNDKVIMLILRSIESKRQLKNLKQAISNLSKKSTIIQFFEFLLKNIDLSIAEFSGSGAEYYSLFDSIRKLNNKVVNSHIEQYVLAGFNQTNYYGNPPQLLLSSLTYLMETGQSVFEKLLSIEHFVKSAPEFSDEFASKLNIHSFKMLEAALKNEPWRKSTLYAKVKHGLQNFNEEIVTYINNQTDLIETPNQVTQFNLPKRELINELRNFYVDDKSLYSTGLIPFFVQNFEKLDSKLISKDKRYIREILEVVLSNYDPDKFIIKAKKIDSSRREFTHNHDSWLSIDLYFKALYLLGDYSQIKKHKIKLLKSLPRMDMIQVKDKNILTEILSLITPLTSSDINVLNEYCLSRRDDLLIMSLHSFSQIIRLLKLKELVPVLIKLINNPRVMMFEQEEALKVIGELSNNENNRAFLNSIFRKHNKNTGNSRLAEIANEYLILNFNDEKAIEWRFLELKKRVQNFDLDYSWVGARSVSTFEMEMDQPVFPTCFYGLDSIDIKRKVLDILIFSFELRIKRAHVKYSYYLQDFVFQYYKSIITQNDLKEIRNTIQTYANPERAGSFNKLLLKLRNELQIRSFRSDTFLNAIHHLNRILGSTYLPINSNEELKDLILGIFDTEIKSLIEDQGFYSVVKALNTVNKYDVYSHNEDTIQKTLKIALEKILLEKGFRAADIYREPQSYDNKRYDFLVKYGLYGPIVIEFKLLNNPEIQNAKQREAYKSKLCTYLAANCGIGIYAVFRTKPTNNEKAKYDELIKEYADIPGLSFNYQDCLLI